MFIAMLPFDLDFWKSETMQTKTQIEASVCQKGSLYPQKRYIPEFPVDNKYEFRYYMLMKNTS